MNTSVSASCRHEAMRIAGKLVQTDDRIEVFNPYDGSVVGTVPAARPKHVREAFSSAREGQSEDVSYVFVSVIALG